LCLFNNSDTLVIHLNNFLETHPSLNPYSFISDSGFSEDNCSLVWEHRYCNTCTRQLLYTRLRKKSDTSSLIHYFPQIITTNTGVNLAKSFSDTNIVVIKTANSSELPVVWRGLRSSTGSQHFVNEVVGRQAMMPIDSSYKHHLEINNIWFYDDTLNNPINAKALKNQQIKSSACLIEPNIIDDYVNMGIGWQNWGLKIDFKKFNYVNSNDPYKPQQIMDYYICLQSTCICSLPNSCLRHLVHHCCSIHIFL